MKAISGLLSAVLLIIIMTSCGSRNISGYTSYTQSPADLEDFLSSTYETTTDSSQTIASQNSDSDSADMSIRSAYNKYRSAYNSIDSYKSFNLDSQLYINIPGTSEINAGYIVSEYNDGAAQTFSVSDSVTIYDENGKLYKTTAQDTYCDGVTVYQRNSASFGTISSNTSEITSESKSGIYHNISPYTPFFSRSCIKNVDAIYGKDGSLKLIFTMDTTKMKDQIIDVLKEFDYDDILLQSYVITININSDKFIVTEDTDIDFDFNNGITVYSGSASAYTVYSNINADITVERPIWVK